MAGLLVPRDRRWPVITIGIDPHKSSLTAVALQPSGDVTDAIGLEVNSDTVGPTTRLGRPVDPAPLGGRRRGRARPGRRAGPGCRRRVGRGCAAGCAGPAAQHRPRPQYRRRRRRRGGHGRSASSSAAPGARRGPQHRAAAALAPTRRPGWGTHPNGEPAPRSAAQPHRRPGRRAAERGASGDRRRRTAQGPTPGAGGRPCGASTPHGSAPRSLPTTRP